MSNILGTCPVCNKGNIVDRDKSYSCDYFKNNDDKCTFVIWKNQFGKEITEEIALLLINKKATSVYSDFVNKEQKAFSASLIINDNNLVSLSFDSSVPDIECPKCQSGMMQTKKGYLCKRYISEECNVYIPKSIAGKEIDQETLSILLKDKTSPFLDGLVNAKNEVFSAKLCLDLDNMAISFDTTIVQCPKCKTGQIKGWAKNYSCSNYKSASPCDFTIWKFQYGGEVSRDNVIDICTNGISKAINFKTKDKDYPYRGTLKIQPDFSIKMDKLT